MLQHYLYIIYGSLKLEY